MEDNQFLVMPVMNCSSIETHLFRSDDNDDQSAMYHMRCITVSTQTCFDTGSTEKKKKADVSVF